MKLIEPVVAGVCLALSLSLAGCGNKVVGAIEDWAKSACACEDKACADSQSVEFDKLEHEYRKEIKELSEKEEQQADEHYRKGRDCLEKFDVHAG